MKRPIAALLCHVMVTTFQLSSVSAKTDSPAAVTLYQNNEITDINNLEKRAEQGITDDPTVKIKNSTNLNSVIAGNGSFTSSSKVTAQKTKAIKYSDGSIKEEYVANAFTTVFETNTQDKYDNTYLAIKYRTKLCYFRYVVNGLSRYDVTTIQGEILEVNDGRIDINKMTLSENNFGRVYNGAGTFIGSYSHLDSYAVDSPEILQYRILFDNQDDWFYEADNTNGHISGKCTLNCVYWKYAGVDLPFTESNEIVIGKVVD